MVNPLKAVSRESLVVLGASTIAAAVAAISLISRAFQIQVLPGSVPYGMASTTAIGILLVSTALTALVCGVPRSVGYGGAIGTLLMGVGGLAGHILGGDTMQPVELFRRNKMAPNTSLCLIAIGIALVILVRACGRPLSRLERVGIAFPVCVILTLSVSALTDTLTGGQAMSVRGFAFMAPYAASTLTMLACATLFMRGREVIDADTLSD